MKITLLGCGASSGVPIIGCECAVCHSPNPKNKRTRVSILVEHKNTVVLVDTSPDMRMQCLRSGIKTVDAIIYTHAHADHITGIDDVRSFNHNKNAPIDVYSDASTLKQLQERFAYCFSPPKPDQKHWYRPCLTPITIEPAVPFTIGDIEFLPFWQHHGQSKTLGLRFGNVAYSTDANGFPEDSWQYLQGLDTWIVDCLRYEIAPTHAHLAMTLEWVDKINPKATYLTHMNHEFDYDALARELPENIYPAYDGLVISS